MPVGGGGAVEFRLHGLGKYMQLAAQRSVARVPGARAGGWLCGSGASDRGIGHMLPLLALSTPPATLHDSLSFGLRVPLAAITVLNS